MLSDKKRGFTKYQPCVRLKKTSQTKVCQAMFLQKRLTQNKQNVALKPWLRRIKMDKNLLLAQLFLDAQEGDLVGALNNAFGKSIFVSLPFGEKVLKKPIEDISSNTSSNEIDYKNLFFGTFWGIVQLTTVALHRVSSKMLVKEKVNENAQVMYPSIACCVLSLLCIICLGKNFSYGFAFVVHCGVNALFWVIFVRLLVISLRGVDLIKTTAIGYLSVLTVFIFGAVFLGEKVFISDIIGSLLILGYNLFNTLYPVKE